ncbi:Retrovirus-related Pol polyprotein from transposon TNT 1-94 [Sesamum alatum]|uniref:Retrovirus-related Pol polyprotein from transposon TNT 1-94 n=1 Tax=Sesamum alatum TaxID=300844 RepID=A0AAE1YF57_9LAMI|nr:Retrovirus-related Pol polyprotein from transposon TNT 1-94 [Sesamum alatum]
MNRSHTKSVHGKTPQEAWSRYKPTITHLRVFGSIAHTHFPDEKGTILDDKSARYVFIGYYQSSKGYKLYNPSSGKIVISRDVEFDEEGVWEWSDQNKNDHYSPFFDDDEEDMAQPITPPSTPPPQNIQDDEASSSEGPRGFRGQRELYHVTEEVTNLSSFTQFCLFVKTEPVNFDDAARDEKWRNALDEEIKVIQKNDSWELESLPKGKNTIGVRWVYKIKRNAKGENDGITPAKAGCGTFKKGLDDEQFNWFLFVCWSLWNFRNSKLVDETQTEPLVLMQNARQHFNALKNTILDQKQTGTPTMVTSWRKPSSSRIKLSFDGAVSTIRKGIGVGVVARNIEGECVDWLASFFTRSTDALHAEALVARPAADLAQRRGWNHADLEGNS